MATRSVRQHRSALAGHKRRPSARNVPAWFVLVKPVFIALFAVMFFLLVYSMSHHGFFSGGPSTYPRSATRPYAP